MSDFASEMHCFDWYEPLADEGAGEPFGDRKRPGDGEVQRQFDTHRYRTEPPSVGVFL
jgi:hypothetical protein